jgi:hypothetical protein
MNYVFVKRLKDGAVMDIPETHLEDTLKQGFELVRKIEPLYENATVEPPKIENPFECPICGFIAKSEFGLKTHKRKHYADSKE